MSIQDLGSIGELIAAIATLATLIYLATQIRQNTKTINSNNSNTLMQGFNQFNVALFSDERLAQIWFTGNSSYEALKQEEVPQFIHMLATVMNIYRNLYLQYRDGTFSENQWLPWAKEAKQILDSPGGKLFRETTRTFDDLCDYLDQLSVDSASPIDFERYKG